jgi:hypothetical protein
VEAIAGGDRDAFGKVMLLHNDDLTRSDGPHRSPRAGLYTELAR